MRWSELDRNPAPGKLRQFGVLLAIVLSVCGLAALARGSAGWLGALGLGVGALAGLLAAFAPGGLRMLFVAVTMATFPLGWVVAHLALGLIYFGLITPLALVFRLLGRDVLDLRRRPGEVATYWARKTSDEDRRRMFRQY